MAIESLGNLSNNFSLNLIDNVKDSSVKTSDNASIFETFLDASAKMYGDTNALQKDVEAKQIAFATGENDNILDVMLAQEKATTALTFTVQVTNKLVDAYKEIMQVQL